MPNEIIIDITTGVLVLGSVFGISHLRKIRKAIRERIRMDELPRKSLQPETILFPAEQKKLR